MAEKYNNILAVIPARGGSKRIPGKNVRMFSGKPLIYYTIRFAQLQKRINKIVISTDDYEIKDIAEKLGVEVIIRPKELATDFTPSADVIKHVLIELYKKNIYFDLVVTLQVTNPLRPENLFLNCLKQFENNLKSNCLISISKNILKLGTIKNGFFNPANYSLGQRSQDLLPNYFENGLIYISHSNSILNENSIISGNILPYIVDHQFPIVDIDEEIDFVYGEFLFNKNIELFNYLL